jgi:hypothetical protein
MFFKLQCKVKLLQLLLLCSDVCCWNCLCRMLMMSYDLAAYLRCWMLRLWRRGARRWRSNSSQRIGVMCCCDLPTACFLLDVCVAYSSILKMDTIRFPETLGNVHQILSSFKLSESEYSVPFLVACDQKLSALRRIFKSYKQNIRLAPELL